MFLALISVLSGKKGLKKPQTNSYKRINIEYKKRSRLLPQADFLNKEWWIMK